MMLEKTFKEMWGFLGSLDFSTATREVWHIEKTEKQAIKHWIP